MAGHQEALTLLVERHYGSVLGYLFRLTGGNRPLAEDLTQETFICLLRRSGYLPQRPFTPWLYAIATNLARDHFKSAEVRHAAPAEASEALLEVQDVARGPDDLALAAEQGREVAAAVARLGEEYRAAVILRFYHGLSLQEIAATLDVPLGTVKSRLSVGAGRLRELLRPAHEGAHP